MVGKLQGLPHWLDETIIALNGLDLVVLWFGTVGLALYDVVDEDFNSGIWLYHVAAIGMLAGLTRYRVPLEPLLMIYAAWFFVQWGQNWKAASTSRKIGAMILGGTIVVFTMWFFPAGWVGWRHW